MRILAAGNSSSRQTGLTLIEIMVVLVLMALVTSLAVVSLNPGRSDAEKTARSLASTLEGLSFAAIAQARSTGLTLDNDIWQGYAFRDGAWNPIGSAQATGRADTDVQIAMRIADEFEFPDEDNNNVRLLLRGGPTEEEPAPQPPLQFSPVGDVSPATFSVVGPEQSWTVILAANGDVEVRRAN